MVDLKSRSEKSSGGMGRLSVAIVSAIAFSLGGCGNNPPVPSSESSPTEEKELQVVTTFLPITQFTKAVAGDRAEVIQLLPSNVGLHEYQAKPQDVQKVAQADVLVQNGLGAEEFLEDLVQNAGNERLKVIDSSQGVESIASPTTPEHNHAEEEEASHQHGKHNPHIWLDPKRAMLQVENIRDGLIAADPGGKEVYTANAGVYLEKLKKLDAATAKILQPYMGKTFVAFHDFAPYFAQSYNLKANFLVDVPEENPSPEDVQRVIKTVRESELKTLLQEPSGDKGAFAALSQDLQVRVSSFEPMESGGEEAQQPDYYITTMEQNVKALVKAFTGQALQSRVLF